MTREADFNDIRTDAPLPKTIIIFPGNSYAESIDEVEDSMITTTQTLANLLNPESTRFMFLAQKPPVLSTFGHQDYSEACD